VCVVCGLDPDLLMRGMDNSDSGRERSLSMESLSSDSEGGSQINGMSVSGSGSGIGVEVERGPVGGALVVPRIGYGCCAAYLPLNSRPFPH
jgi:hypothetical protein